MVLNRIKLFFSTLALLLATANIALAQQKVTKVELLRAKTIKSNSNIANGARRLIGNVAFRQETAIMECDSAYFYADRNAFDAFGHVHLYKENDNNVEVKADYLHHDGNKKIAQFRNHVVLRDSQIVMTTDSLDYDTFNDIGYYDHSATIVDSATTLKSIKGYYYNKRNEVYFWNKVEIDHNLGEYQMFTDTLLYNTESKIATFFGPTHFYNDTNYMYARYGWYNTDNETAMFKHDALFRNPHQTVTCDSMGFNRTDESGRAMSNVVAVDSSQNVKITGHYVEMHKEPELLIVTDSALVIYIMEGDSLFIHADTLQMEKDTNDIRSVRAFNHVRAFKSDLQFQTDSIFFSLRDSIAQFHGSPIFWLQGNQVTAAYIEAYIKNNELEYFKLFRMGFMVSPQDETHYNQIKGREMTGYMRNNALYKLEVHEDSRTLYFPTDQGEIVGMNKGESSSMTINLRNNKISRITYKSDPVSNTYPLTKVKENEMKLQGFRWLDEHRPKKPTDVFVWPNIEPMPTSNRRNSNN